MRKEPGTILFFTVLSIALLLSACSTKSRESEHTVQQQDTGGQHIAAQTSPDWPDHVLRLPADAEVRALGRIVTELGDLENLIQESRSYAEPDARFRFDYELLLADVRRVSAGIQAHIRAAHTDTGSIKPIAGDYRR